MTPTGTRTNPAFPPTPTDILIFGKHRLARGMEHCAQENVIALPVRKHCPTQAGVPRGARLYLTPFPRKTNATELPLQGLRLHPAKMKEVLRKTYHPLHFLEKELFPCQGKKSWINLERRPGLANNQRPHFSELQKSIFLHVNLERLLPFSGFHI